MALYKEYGMSLTDHLRGEFAICIYDAKKQRMILVRDRYSIKPLFYTVINGAFMFASEVKAFLALGWKPEWDIDSVVYSGWLLSDKTCFKGVYKVPAGHYVVATCSGNITVSPYWSMEYPDKTLKETRSVEEMIEGVRERMVDSVKERMVADLPVAVYLSGGIDSSCVAGIANELVRKKDPNERVKLFSISFTDGGIFDEKDLATKSAGFLDADVEMLHLTEDELLENFEDSVWYLEMPFFNLNTVARRQMAKRVQEKGYKVVLTGEGSDEHFGGYMYFQDDYIAEQDHALPPGFETITEEQRKEKLAKSGVEGSSRYMSALPELKDSDPKLRQYLSAGMMISSTISNPKYLSKSAKSYCGTPDLLQTISQDTMDGIVRSKIQEKWHPLNSSMYGVAQTTLNNYILCAMGDRCDMAYSIESRTPFLDHHLTEYVNNLPPSVKIKGNPADGSFNEKWILKEAVKPYITEEIYKRKKEPFIAPMARGHNEKFVALLEKHLTKANIERLGWMDYEEVERSKKKYLNEGSKDNRDHQEMLMLMGFVILSQKFNIPAYKFSNGKSFDNVKKR